MTETKPFRVILWCVPRSASTVITKCFSFLDNTQVWFEPYTMAFFQDFYIKSHTGSPLPQSVEDFDPKWFMEWKRAMAKGTSLEHLFNLPSIDETLILRDGVRRQLNVISDDKSVFIKDMAYGITNFLNLLPCKESGFKHAFLIRSPRKVFPAWRRLMMAQLASDVTPGQAPTFDETTFDMTDVPYMMPGYSYKCQYDLWEHVRKNIDPDPVIIDADDVVVDPLSTLSAFAAATGMPFSEDRLTWDANLDVISKWRTFIPIAHARPGDFIHRTHAHAMFSSGFEKRVKSEETNETFSPDVDKCVKATIHYYEEMAQHKLKPS